MPMRGHGLDRWDYLIVLAILGALTTTLRLGWGHTEAQTSPILQEARSTKGMDAVWRDAVSEKKDLRPLAPDVIWDEPKAEETKPALPPVVKEPVREAPSAFPEPLPAPAPEAPAPRLESRLETFHNDHSLPTSSAFLAFPAPPKAAQAPAAEKAAAKPAKDAPAPESRRLWRRADGR